MKEATEKNGKAELQIHVVESSTLRTNVEKKENKMQLEELI